MNDLPGSAVLGFDAEDVILLRSLQGARSAQITAYLLALSAFRRGLAVTFLRSVPEGAAAPGFATDGSSGEVFRITDGSREVFFNRTATNLLNPLAALRSKDKGATKELLTRAGIRVPGGITVKAGDHDAVRAFLSASKADRFVVKPVDSSLAEGVLLSLTADEVMQEVRRSRRDRLIVEEYITGTELRVSVVGDQVVAAFIRHPANVTGDGVHTIEELAALKTARRLKHPGASAGIELDEDKLRFLESAGRKVSDIPAAGEKVVLSRYRNGVHGADFETATQLLNDSLKRICVAAAKVMGLAVTGIDLVISDNPATPGSFILELNERPNQTLHTFPTMGESAGMSLADAMIDFYFPESKHAPRHGNAVFDSRAIVDAMQSTAAEEIALPRLSPEWQHLRIGFRSSRIAAGVNSHLRLAGGVTLEAVTADGSRHLLDILLSPRSRMFLLGSRATIASLAPELDAAIRWPDPVETGATLRAEATGIANSRR